MDGCYCSIRFDDDAFLRRFLGVDGHSRVISVACYRQQPMVHACQDFDKPKPEMVGAAHCRLCFGVLSALLRQH